MHKMEAEEKEVALQYAREYFNSGQSTYRDSCVTTPNIYLSFIMHSAKKVRIPPLAISLSSQQPVSNSNGCAFLMRLEWKEDQNHEKIHHISADPAQFSAQTMRRQNGRIAPEATKWLLHAEEKLQCLLSAHKTVCLLSNVSPPYQPSKLHNNPKIGKSQGWTAQDFWEMQEETNPKICKFTRVYESFINDAQNLSMDASAFSPPMVTRAFTAA